MGKWKWILPQYMYVATHKSNNDDNVEKVYVVAEEEDIMVEQEAPWSPRPSTGTRLIWASDETEGNLHVFCQLWIFIGLSRKLSWFENEQRAILVDQVMMAWCYDVFVVIQMKPIMVKNWHQRRRNNNGESGDERKRSPEMPVGGNGPMPQASWTV